MADHVFVCYARKNQDFVLKLATTLKERNVPVWVDQWHIPTGADWDHTIDEAIDDCAYFLIILSPEATKSREVRGELRTALDENKPIVPVLYQPCRIPRQLRLVQYVDYTPQGPGEAAALRQLFRFLGEAHPVSPDRSPATTSPRREKNAASPAPPGSRQVQSKPQPTNYPQILSPNNSSEPELILIPAGEFLMGSDPYEDRNARADEQPQHSVYLPDYYIAKTPVTNAQYAAFVQVAGHRAPYVDKRWAKSYNWDGQKPPPGKESHPAVLVSWDDAVAFCVWLTEISGRTYRLPTEAEWEKAARGSEGRIYPWDNEWDAGRCNTGEGGKGDTPPVGAYPDGASPYGVLDMSGNVWEWCATKWKKPYPYDVEEDEWSADYLDGAGVRALRGGSWHGKQDLARCARRDGRYPGDRNYLRGFRLASHV